MTQLSDLEHAANTAQSEHSRLWLAVTPESWRDLKTRQAVGAAYDAKASALRALSDCFESFKSKTGVK